MSLESDKNKPRTTKAWVEHLRAKYVHPTHKRESPLPEVLRDDFRKIEMPRKKDDPQLDLPLDEK